MKNLESVNQFSAFIKEPFFINCDRPYFFTYNASGDVRYFSGKLNILCRSVH